jgi:putative ABC transport system permease protein
MIKNYLQDASRNIKNRKGYSFINISSLTIGLVCFILLFMWVREEISFDRFHLDKDELYRVIEKNPLADNEIHTVMTHNPLGPTLKNEYPEVINFTRTRIVQGWVIILGDKQFTNDNIAIVDPSFFEMFTFPFIKGNAKTALNNMRSVVLTERMAKKYFADQDPLDKVLQITGFDFKVTGIIKDVPLNSHIMFDCVIPLINMKYFWETDFERWDSHINFSTYIQLQKNSSGKELSKKITDIVKKNIPESKTEVYLQPLSDIHLYSKLDVDINNYKQGNITYVYLLSILALAVLFIACFNYMNLSTARSADRTKGIAIRKVSGASRGNIIRQFLGETIFLSMIALILAVILVYFLLPLFNDLSGKQLTFNLLLKIPFLLELIAIAVVIGLIAGSYPALYLSSFQPVTIMKGGGITPQKGKLFFRKTLVIIQFAIAIFLILSTIVIYTQLEFMRNKDLGFDPHNIITFFTAHQLENNFEEKKALFMSNPNVLNFSMGGVPMFLFESETDDVSWEGNDPNERITIFPSHIDIGYIELYKMKILEGRSFSKEFPTDVSAFILNETAVKAMGLKSPLGKRLRVNGQEGTIIGVVKDYHHRPLQAKIIPVVLMLNYAHGMASVRLHPQNVAETLHFLEKTWNKINRSPYPFTYTFADETIDNLYKSEGRIGAIAKYSTLITLLISCLGLFGLSSYTSRQRTKEISIRKISGASVSGIVLLLSKEFIRWIITALIIAYPLAWYGMSRWLQSYAYRIGIEWWMFVFTGAAALVIGFFTVGYQAIKAARANPIDNLRYE